MIFCFFAVRKSWLAWFTGKTLPKLYRFFTDFSFCEVKTGPKLTVSGTIFRFVRKIGPKLTENGMNFEFCSARRKLRRQSVSFHQVPGLGWVVLSPEIRLKQCLGSENGPRCHSVTWFSTASLAIPICQRTEDRKHRQLSKSSRPYSEKRRTPFSSANTGPNPARAVKNLQKNLSRMCPRV
jgi:hypothetical protein